MGDGREPPPFARTFAAIASRISGRTHVGTVAKIVLLGAVNGLLIAMAPRLVSARAWLGLTFMVVATVAIDAVYLSRRNVHLKYLVPGTIFLVLFQLYPVAFNAYISFTNFGTGNILTQDQALEQVLRRSIDIAADAARYQAVALSDADGTLALLLTDADGQRYLGTAEGLRALEPSEVTGEGATLAVADFRRMTLREASDRQDEVLAFVVPVDGGEVRLQTFTAAALATTTLAYDAATGTLVSTVDGTVYRPAEGYYTAPDGTRLTPGWRVVIGMANFERVLTSKAIRGPFLRVLLWTYAFAGLSVLLTFAVGLLLALALNDPRVRGLRIYRALLIVPYALPSFMTALIWAGLLNQDFGAVNRVLGLDVNWLGDPWIAKASVLLVNTWLGFPYMFLISLGALQSIPTELREAAFVDGASGFKAFRFVTLPLLLVSLAPLLISSFAFNFNNFNTIFLLTGGGPPIQGAQTPAGHTDILISYTYRLAFETGRGNDWGFASAIAVIIFLLVAVFSAASFRWTRTFEEIS